MTLPVQDQPDDAAGRKNMLQLIQLRWIAFGGQVATIAAAWAVFHIALPFGPMILLLAALAGLNVVSLLRLAAGARIRNGELMLAVLMDVALLTGQLGLSGGATNPFISLYLLQVTLSAVLLEAWSAWTVAAVTAICFALLTTVYRPLALPPDRAHDLFALHIQGMLVCFLLDAGLLMVFLIRVERNLRARDAHLADLRQQAAEEDHIVRMGLLASGAAHELGTPLATVSVILNDWKRLPAIAAGDGLLEELEEMEQEVQRCKAIVTGILISAGEARGEAPEVTSARDFVDATVADWRASRPFGEFAYENMLPARLPIVSDSALRQVICNVLDNAADASPAWMGLKASREGDTLILAVSDAGPGFTPEMLANFGKPYNSTKGRRGGGLGLFLVVNVLRKLGGQVEARNRPGGGAAVTLTLPLSILAVEDEALAR